MIYFQSQVDALLKVKNEKIVLLESMLSIQATSLAFEKKRADAAIDQVIALSGGRPVSQPPRQRQEITDKILAELGNISRAGREFGEEPKAE